MLANLLYMLRTLFLFIMLLFTASLCEAQTFGETPPSIKWRQINTPAFRIIFPSGIDSIANKVAEDIHLIANPMLETIGTKKKKIDIVMRNEGILSNGYVGLAPFRSEFYLTPPSDPFQLGSIPWPDLLSIHEYRHVQQYNNFNVGLSKAFSTVFGEGGQAFANAASVPDWFFEGDAVYAESNITKQGRGALPYFYNGYRVLWAEGKKYNWMKLRNGSYRDFIPNKYILGFMLTAYGNDKYGRKFWKDVTHDAAAFKSLIYPFQHSLKKHSGQDFKSFRDSAFSFFKTQFDDEMTGLAGPDYHQNEQFPVFDTAGNLLFLKSSVKEVPHFVTVKNGKFQKLRVADYMVDDYFSYRRGKIVYAARRYHPRWTSRASNEIRVLDVATNRQKTITKKTRYFSPDINEAGNQIIAVSDDAHGKSSLHLINAQTGDIIARFSHPDVLRFVHPKFEDDKIISAIANREGQMSIAQIDMVAETFELLLPLSDNVIGFPLLQSDTVYFSVSQRLSDELFALTLSDKMLWKISADVPSIGKYHVAVSSDSVAWTSFSSQGLRIKTIGRSRMKFTAVPQKEFDVLTSGFGLMAIHRENANLIYTRPDSVFPVEKYSSLTRPFNFHTLMPMASDPEYSLSLVGENILNTFTSELSFLYNRAEGSKRAGIDFSYGGLFPVLSFGYDYSFDRRVFTDSQFVYFNTSEPYVGFHIPLNLSSNRMFRSLSFGSTFRHSSRMMQKPYSNKYQDATVNYLNSFISFSNQSQIAAAQVLPRFAQSIYLNHRFPLGNVSGYQYLIRGRLFLPGIGLTNSMNFTVAYSQKDTLSQIGFSNPFPFARGYEAVNLHKMYGAQANYQFPLLYPDAGFANIAYLLRLRTNIFYDHTFTTGYTSTKVKFDRTFRSVGGELFFDTKWWNQVFVSFGVRYSYLLDADVIDPGRIGRFELIMPVNLFNR